MLPGVDTALASRADRRLHAKQEIWITTVRSDGQPQASPVGFLWDGDTVLIMSQPGSQKVRNLRANPRVALHLDIDRQADRDNGIVTLEGVAALDSQPISTAETTRYLEKYADLLASLEMTADELLAEYSTVIRVRPTRARVY
ncbi:MAG: TIGR03667 family PPOX class F420-dependent oxidoreductase [Natronosporangium sp.]